MYNDDEVQRLLEPAASGGRGATSERFDVDTAGSAAQAHAHAVTSEKRSAAAMTGGETSIGQLVDVEQPKLAKRMSTLLECPICTADHKLPIYQCRNGHTICPECTNKLRYAHPVGVRPSGGGGGAASEIGNFVPCPSCRVPMEVAAMIRNRSMEDMAAEHEVTCTFRTSGCNETVRFLNRGGHEAECDYNPRCTCPFSDLCAWGGPAAEMLMHKDSNSQKRHPSAANVLTELHLDKPVRLACALLPMLAQDPGTYDTKVYHLAGTAIHLLFVRRWVAPMQSHAAFFKFLGPPEQRKDYVCEIKVGHPFGHELVWRGRPFKAREKNAGICEGRLCLLIPDQLIRRNLLDLPTDGAGTGSAGAGSAGLSDENVTFTLKIRKIFVPSAPAPPPNQHKF